MTLGLQNEAFRSSQDERHRGKILNTHPAVPLLPTHALTKGGLHGTSAVGPVQYSPPPTCCLFSFQQQQQERVGGGVSEAELKGRKGGSFPTSFIRL